jgi:hypothetical protein
VKNVDVQAASHSSLEEPRETGGRNITISNENPVKGETSDSSAQSSSAEEAYSDEEFEDADVATNREQKTPEPPSVPPPDPSLAKRPTPPLVEARKQSTPPLQEPVPNPDPIVNDTSKPRDKSKSSSSLSEDVVPTDRMG